MHVTCSIVSVFPWDICKMSSRMAKCIYHVLKIKRPFQCPNKKKSRMSTQGGGGGEGGAFIKKAIKFTWISYLGST